MYVKCILITQPANQGNINNSKKVALLYNNEKFTV